MPDDIDQTVEAPVAFPMLGYAPRLVRAIIGGRGAWALGDQAMLSLGNFLTNILLVRNWNHTPERYGKFAALFILVLFLNNLHGSLVTYPMSLTCHGDDDDTLARRVFKCLGISFSLGLVLSLVLGAVAACVGGLWLAFWAVAAMIVWQTQETLRRAMLGRLEHHRAVAGDAISYLGQAVAIFIITRHHSLSLETAFGLIAASSGIGAVLQAIQLGVLRHQSRPIAQIAPEATVKHHWEMGRWVLLSNVMGLATVYATPWLLALFHGAKEVAAYQAIANLLGVSNPIVTSMSNLTVSSVAKANAATGLHAAAKAARGYTLQAASLLFPYYIVLMLFPHLMLRLFYKADSPYLVYTTPLRLIIGVNAMYFLSWMGFGFFNGLGKSRWSFYAQMTAAIANCLVCMPLAIKVGLTGAIGGGLVPMVAQIIVITYFLRMLFQPREDLNSDPDLGDSALEMLRMRSTALNVMTPMSITVLMPAYNAERFLAPAIESVLAQTYRDFEFIIINDGSTDSTLDIARSYAEKDSRIRIITHENMGMGASLNQGMLQATGDWIARIDADDLMAPHRLERQIAFLNEYPDLAVASSLVRYIDETGKVIGKYSSTLTTRQAVQQCVAEHSPIGFHHPATIFRKKIIQDLGGYRPEFWPADDMDLWNRVIDAGHAVLVQEEYLTKYRIHGSSVTVSRFAATERKAQWVQACILARHHNKPEPTLQEFLTECGRRPWIKRVNARRRDYARALYKLSVFQFSQRRYSHFVPNLLAAMAMEPKYVLNRVLPQFRRMKSPPPPSDKIVAAAA